MGLSVGFLGGTFNPVHDGHLLLAEAALVQQKLDEILFVPNAIPPHRSPSENALADPETRYVMTVLATLPNSHFRVSRIELERKGTSYTYDTVIKLKEEQPLNRYYFICGADCLVRHVWHRFGDLLEVLDGILIAPRPGENLAVSLEKLEGEFPLLREKVSTIRMEPVAVSGTQIRQCVRDGLSIRSMVPKSVAEYIERYRVYEEVVRH